MPPTAWAISNRQPYGEEINHPDSLLLAGPQVLGRFTTTPLAKAKGQGSGSTGGGAVTYAGCCNITRLGPGACVETAEAVDRIKRHLETILDRRLETVVADFTRDDKDRLWCLQVCRLLSVVWLARRATRSHSVCFIWHRSVEAPVVASESLTHNARPCRAVPGCHCTRSRSKRSAFWAAHPAGHSDSRPRQRQKPTVDCAGNSPAPLPRGLVPFIPDPLLR